MRSVLMIDDDEDDRMLFQEVVKSIDRDIHCWTSPDAQAALEMLRHELIVAPDIIFLDVNMPRLNGLEFLKIIRSEKGFTRIPVIMYTTSSNPHDMKNAKQLGASDYIIKPSDFTELHGKLKSIIERLLSPACSD
jgi:CheY-like chemotaxis protein